MYTTSHVHEQKVHGPAMYAKWARLMGMATIAYKNTRFMLLVGHAT